MSKFMWAGVGMLPLAALAMMGGTALAADLPVQLPPLAPMAGSAPIISWTGFYIGAQAGYGWGGGAAAFGNGSSGASQVNPAGFFGGGQVGYNWEMSNGGVVGIEGDIAGASMTGQLTTFGPTVTITQGVSALGSVRARLGYAMGRWLPYVTGGVAFAEGTRTEVAFGTSTSATNWHTGWTAGAGLEYAIDNHWSVRGEYRYSDFGTKNYAIPAPGGQGTNVHLTASLLTAALNYRW